MQDEDAFCNRDTLDDTKRSSSISFADYEFMQCASSSIECVYENLKLKFCWSKREI